MIFRLILLFTIIPLVELAILIEIGRWLGLLPTLIIVIGTGILGAALAQHQGFKVITDIRNSLSIGRVPKEELLDALLILIGGVVLLTPGLMTDILGFLLLIPHSRVVLKTWLKKKFRGYIDKQITVTEIKVD